MPTSLVDRLSSARLRQFVGRAPEIGLFQSALADASLPFNVLYISGPGGVGKSTLLNQFIAIAEQSGARPIYLDARNVEPSPEALENALCATGGLSPGEDGWRTLGFRPETQVVMIDTYESLAPLDHWVRDRLLPLLPENVLLVLAGRNSPSASWRADAAWQTLIRTIALRNLSPQESRDLLNRRAVPGDQHQAVLDFTHGHPLALALVADVFDQRPNVRFEPASEPDVVKILLEQFAQKVPGPAHRAALEVCVLVRTTTEGLLCEMLAMPEVHELFEWLRGLSFIEARREGLFPHDLAREAMVTDLRWRNPDWYNELHKRARAYYFARLGQGGAQQQQRILLDYIFLHRDNPVVRPFFEWQTAGSLLTDGLNEKDVPALLAMVAKHEGDESARIAAHWFESQPQGTMVFREPQGEPVAFMLMIDLALAAADALALDPAVRATWNYLRRRAPLRSGEVATLFRYWLAYDTYQDVSPAQSLTFVNAVRHYLTTPNIAYTFFPVADPEFWAPVFAYAELQRLREADFEVGGRRYGMYGHDWRTMPPMAWLAVMGDRETALEEQPKAAAAPQLLVLSETEFISAVHEALRNMTRPDALVRNPLLSSRLVVERAGGYMSTAERVRTLQNIISGAAEALQNSPRDAKLFRALQQTYFTPAMTQEEAAEKLDLPFSTYRRHLKSGEMRVAEILWQREIGVLEK